MKLPNGAYAPVPTPVDDAGDFDARALADHLAHLGDHGLDGALILGTNGEFPSFDIGERQAIAEAAGGAGHGLDLMLGVGSCALPEVLELARAAADQGFGSVLVPPPFYFRTAPEEGLAVFFRAVLDSSSLPVLLYHIPQVTGVPISDCLLDEFAGHPRFGGVKDSSGNEMETERILAKIGGGSYMVGNDRLLTSSRRAGGSGSITAAASVVPSLVAATHRDPSRQSELDAVRGLLEEYGLGPAVKAILRSMGLGAYRTRPPLLDLAEPRAAELLDRFHRLTI
jgi:4-hydroxy-tetrahydrodipicolinate synthase